jgi:SAM-dependent methyltransferase
MPERWSAFDLAEAFHLSQAVWTLHRLGLLDALEKPMTAERLAAKHGLDAEFVRGTLTYVAARSDLLRRSGCRFALKGGYSNTFRFLFDLYLGAYGRQAVELGRLLRDPSAAPRLIDRSCYAHAFDAVDGVGVLPALIRGLGINHLLDLGCGSAALLRELAKHDDDFIGWGLESNPAMCRVARRRIRAAGLSRRIRVLAGDCRDVARSVPPKIRTAVGGVTACNVANEMFGQGHQSAVEWFRGLRHAFAGRPLLVADYYGRLWQGKRNCSPETLLHDYVQLISGQGVPPADAGEWRRIYRHAGCRLIHMVEDKNTTRFIHVLRL